MKLCIGCGETLPLDAFWRAPSKDGRMSRCKDCRGAQAARTKNAWRSAIPGYHTNYRRPPEQADRKRARRRVSMAVLRGKIPPASALRCSDCGEPAAQYDHHRGYAPEQAFDVEPVCTRCHGLRSRYRGEHARAALDGREGRKEMDRG